MEEIKKEQEINEQELDKVSGGSNPVKGCGPAPVNHNNNNDTIAPRR